MQSTALLVLAAQGDIDYPLFLFANTGDDSEHPDTLAFVRDHAIPYADKHGIELIELRRTRRDGTPETLYGRLTNPDTTSIGIPAYLPSGAPASRSCTVDFKIRVIGKELKARGASEDDPAVVAIGISTDEVQRATSKNTEKYRTVAYPLLDLGLSRADCHAIIEASELPVPAPSSCFFCPFHRPQVWSEMRRDRPDLFERAADLEAAIVDKLDAKGRQPMRFTRTWKPLRQAIGEAGPELPLWADGCDTGHCFT